jgi:HK97 family phage prohead protease
VADHKTILRELRKRHQLGDDARVGVRSMALDNSGMKVKQAEDDDAPVRVSAIASTDSVDLAEEVLIPAGADPTTHSRYKAILYEHNPLHVLGRLVSANYEKHRDLLHVSFDIVVKGSERNREVAMLVREGAINGVSVGFLRKSWGPPSESEAAKYAGAHTVVREWEWLETSVVALPCNREALIESVKSGRASKTTVIDLGVPKEAFAFNGKKAFALVPKKRIGFVPKSRPND